MSARALALLVGAFVCACAAAFFTGYSWHNNDIESRLSEAVRISGELADENQRLRDTNQQLADGIRDAQATVIGLRDSLDRVSAAAEEIQRGLRGASAEIKELVRILVDIGKGNSAAP